MTVVRDFSTALGSVRPTPDDEEIALASENSVFTYAQLAELTDRWVSALRLLDLEDARPVVVMAEKTVACVSLIAALQSIGASVMILPAGMGREVRRIVAEKAGACVELSIAADGLVASDLCPLAGPVPEAAKEAAFVLATSGSTGVPKAVCVPQAGLSAFFVWARGAFDLQVGTKVLSFAPLNFDLSLLEVWATLDAGGTVILADPELSADGASLARLVAETEPDIVQGVPLLYKLLTSVPDVLFSATRAVIVTGEAASRELRQRIAPRFPNARFHNIYGSTETNDSFQFSCDALAFADLEKLPIGSPLSGCRYRIVDATGNEIFGPGEGELHTSTPFIANGYTDADQTESHFYRDGLGSEMRRFYRTGDMVRRDEHGVLQLVGRRDHVVKIRGVRINLIDIETTLELHEHVEAAVVCPIADGGGETRLHAVIQARAGLSALDLRQHCAALLSRSAIPKQFTLTDLPLPRTSTGKPDRRKVAALHVSKEL